MALRRKNGRLEPNGNEKERIGSVLQATKEDEVVVLGQLTNIVTDTGVFVNVDPDHAIKIDGPNGPIYLAILIVP